MAKRFQFAIIALLFFSYCNAAIYRVDDSSIKDTAVYCLYDWHACVNDTVNGMQRDSIIAAAKKFQNIYGCDEVVIIAEDPSNFDPRDPIFASLSGLQKQTIAKINAEYKNKFVCGAVVGLHDLCKQNNIIFHNIEFRQVRYYNEWGYAGITAADADAVFDAVKKEVKNNGYAHLATCNENETVSVRLLQRILQNLNKKCIIVVAGGRHIENVAPALKKLGVMKSYGTLNDAALKTQEDDYEKNCLAVESVFDVHDFFMRELSAGTQTLATTTIVAHQRSVTTVSQTASATPATTRAGAHPPATPPKSWLQAIWSRMTFKNICIVQLCILFACLLK